MMNFGENSRMSHIRDRNIYLETDKLYEPLRIALRKSTVSQSPHLSELSSSRAGRSMRSLSPSEAETIKRNLLIPINKQLVATRNIQKVMGKSFTAVDVTETVKQALTPEQFSRIRKGTTQEIVYEIKNHPHPLQNSNIYTARENTASRALNSINHNLRESKVVRFEQGNTKSQVRFITQPNRQNTVNIYTHPKSPTNGYTIAIKPLENNGFRIDNRRENRMFIPKYNHQISQEIIQQPENSISSINKSMTSIKALRNDIKVNDDLLSDTKVAKPNPNLYQFRSNKSSDKATRLSNRSRSRDEYRYNVSNKDESGNLGCQPECCHSNQLFPSKRPYNPWK